MDTQRVAEENTPLLEGSTTSAQHGTNSEQELEEHQQGLPLHQRLLYIGSVTSLCLIILGLAFAIASSILASIGSQKYGFWPGWDFATLRETICFGSFIAIPLTIANLVLLRRKGPQMPGLINIGYFGIGGVFSVLSAASLATNELEFTPTYCDADLDERFGKGTKEDCLSWAIKYQIIIWCLLILVALFGILQCALFVIAVTRLFRNRSRTGAVARWYIPQGQLAFEVSIRWGSPRAQRQEQTESIEGGRGSES